MATFDYTAATWKKMKPPLFPKTGMTDALADFEKAAKKVFAAGTLPSLLEAAGPAMEAFDKVEKCRKQALAKAPKMFSDTRTALDKAPSAQTVNKLHEAIAKVGGRELDEVASKITLSMTAKQKRLDDVHNIMTILSKIDSLEPQKRMKFLSNIYLTYINPKQAFSKGRTQLLPGVDIGTQALLNKRSEGLVAKNTPMLLTRFSRVLTMLERLEQKNEECRQLELSLREKALPMIQEAGITED